MDVKCPAEGWLSIGAWGIVWRSRTVSGRTSPIAGHSHEASGYYALCFISKEILEKKYTVPSIGVLRHGI